MENLKVLENELVPVYETSTGEKVVYGIELHKVLGVKTRYNDWSERRLIDVDAVKNEDYEILLKNEQNLKGGRPTKNHIIKLDTAKEMAMLERNEKGKQVRRYFIEVEKKYKELKEELSKENQLILSIVNSDNKENRVIALAEYKEVLTTPLLENIAEQRKTIEQKEADNKALAGKILDWADRNRINAGIRKLAAVTGANFGKMWNRLYEQLKYGQNIDIKSRKEKDAGKKKVPYIEYIREDEWDKVLKVFSALCKVYGESPTEMLREDIPLENLDMKSSSDSKEKEDAYAWLDNM